MLERIFGRERIKDAMTQERNAIWQLTGQVAVDPLSHRYVFSHTSENPPPLLPLLMDFYPELSSQTLFCIDIHHHSNPGFLAPYLDMTLFFNDPFFEINQNPSRVHLIIPESSWRKTRVGVLLTQLPGGVEDFSKSSRGGIVGELKRLQLIRESLQMINQVKENCLLAW